MENRTYNNKTDKFVVYLKSKQGSKELPNMTIDEIILFSDKNNLLASNFYQNWRGSWTENVKVDEKFFEKFYKKNRFGFLPSKLIYLTDSKNGVENLKSYNT